MVVLLAALAVKFAPLLMVDEEPRDETVGSGTYKLIENTRASMVNGDLGLDSIAPIPGIGNLIWIEHTCSDVDPDIVGGWSLRKILIQLPGRIRIGDKFDVRIPGSNAKTKQQGSGSTQMSDGMLDVYVFVESADDYWMSRQLHLQDVHLHGQNATTPSVVIGSVTILQLNPTTATILLDLPDQVTMRPESGALPAKIQLIRNGHSAKK